MVNFIASVEVYLLIPKPCCKMSGPEKNCLAEVPVTGCFCIIKNNVSPPAKFSATLGFVAAPTCDSRHCQMLCLLPE